MQSVPFGTPSLFNSRRKASDGKEETPPQGLVQGTPCTPSFDGDTPTMLRRLRSPPPSPTGKFKRDAVRLAFAAVIGILMLSTLFSYRMTMGSAADERLSVLTTLVRSQQDEMIELQKTVRTQSTTIASLAARSSKSEAAPKIKPQGTPSGVGTAGVATPEKSRGMKHVHVVFRFDEDRRMGKEVQLFWLYENNTEQLYTTIPAGLQADETTFPGQCWRARDPRSGNHLLSYCATSEPLQTVHIAPSTNVKLDFHFPPTAKLAERVRVLALGDGSSTPSLVGELAQGGRVSTRAVAGAKFKVVEVVKGLDRPLLQMTASHEAEQHVDIGSSVSLTVQLPATAFGPAELFWLWGGDDAFAREHLHGSVLPGQTLRIATMAGEQWIAKDKASGTVLLTTTTTDAAEQSVELSAVAAPAVEKKAARFVKAARKR